MKRLRASRGDSQSVAGLITIFGLLAFVPLALLTYFSLSLSTKAVDREVKSRIRATASLSAVAVQSDLEGLTELVKAYADRPRLSEALLAQDSSELERQLRELRAARRGIAVAFVAQPNATLTAIVPSTPSIIGKNFSFRDWYRGLSEGGGPYVSRAYRTQAKNHALVVAAASYVLDRSGGRARGRPLGILVAGYNLVHIQELSDKIAEAQRVNVEVTDQGGTVLTGPQGAPRRLQSDVNDPNVAAALRGAFGITQLREGGVPTLRAYAPVPGIGWTVSASVPADAAFAAVGGLRRTVLTIVGALVLVLLGGLAWLARTLRGRRRAEEQARRLVNINKAVLDATPDGILLVDREGRRVLENAALGRLAGEEMSPEATVYDNIEASAERISDPERFRRFMQSSASDSGHQATETFDTSDGSAYQIYTAPVRDSSDDQIGRIFTVRDVSAERQAEALKSELVATVSHELRTPLASILGFAELLTQREQDEQTQKQYVATIHGEAKRLTNLINDFLDLQRIEQGSFTLALEPFDLGAVLREQHDVYAAQSAAHSLTLELPDEPLTLLGESDRIAQVVGNLISNAIKYSPEGGTVRVSASGLAHTVRVSVEDSGIGIPADQQRKLFTKFFRVDTSDTRKIGGTGLGLALCREIVEAHGGRIGFETTEGEGSTFWFELPRAASHNGSSDGYILIVEDDPAAAALLSEYLALDGHGVEVTASAEACLALVKERPPLLICLDITLAGNVDGWQALSQLKSTPATAEIPVVICTSRNGRQQATALGAADFITKPFSAKRIREAVERLLPQGARSVLVVDDDPAVRRLLRETLRDRPLAIREAEDGQVALAEIRRETPDLVVLDLLMPEVDGFEVLEGMHEHPETREVPVIVLTGHSLSAEERTMLRERAVSLLHKSAYSPHELRLLVEQALAAPHA